MFPSSFPSSVPCPGLPFPPRGPFGSVPPLLRYYERLRLPAAPPARASVALRTSVPAPLSCSLSRRDERFPCASRGRLRVAHPLFARNGRISQVPGDPPARAPRSQTPAGPTRLASRRFGAAVAPVDDARSGEDSFRGSMTRHRAPCVRFAAGVAPAPRNTRFRLVASLCRTGFVLLGPTEGFGRYMMFPFSRLPWRTNRLNRGARTKQSPRGADGCTADLKAERRSARRMRRCGSWPRARSPAATEAGAHFREP